MNAFAMYRLPYGDHYARVEQAEGTPRRLLSLNQLNGKRGFVFAPFAPSAEEPVYLIEGPTEVRACPEVPAMDVLAPMSAPGTQPDGYYRLDFANFYAQVQVGTFRKLVLSRCWEHTDAQSPRPEDLFFMACSVYPRMFVALVHISDEVTWLMATPELLLEGGGDNQWRTVSLAGTMDLRAAKCAPWTDASVENGRDHEPSSRQTLPQSFHPEKVACPQE